MRNKVGHLQLVNQLWQIFCKESKMKIYLLGLHLIKKSKDWLLSCKMSTNPSSTSRIQWNHRNGLRKLISYKKIIYYSYSERNLRNHSRMSTAKPTDPFHHLRDISWSNASCHQLCDLSSSMFWLTIRCLQMLHRLVPLPQPP